MNPQRTLLLLAIACCLADLFAGFLKNQHARELKILIKACNSPQLAEGLIRYLYWDLALFGGLRLSIDLQIDDAVGELAAIRRALVRDGLVEDESSTLEPDLVFIV
ncbi:MAG: hypothetical protein ACOX5M_10230 [Bacillota bacterium]|jgi:hypothetical protein